MPPKSPVSEIKYSLAPWISVPVGGINFYKSAFGATSWMIDLFPDHSAGL
jgi:hypothetical protein